MAKKKIMKTQGLSDDQIEKLKQNDDMKIFLKVHEEIERQKQDRELANKKVDMLKGHFKNLNTRIKDF